VNGPDAGARGVLDDQHPWPGLASFEEGDRDFFRGRETEAEALRRLVGRARLCVLFGKSGLGKTSLLQAGLFPRLRQDSMLPVWIRLDFSARAGTLRAQVLQAMRLASTAASVEAPALDEAASLWENLHRREADFWSERQRLVTPILVMDQFEEIFTLGREKRPDECRQFLDELSDLVEGRPAQALRERLEHKVEEADHFSFDRHAYKVVLSLREDFLADLEGLRARMPSLATNRFRLLAMNGPEALEVVGVPGRHLIEADVAERVVRFVARAGEDEPLAELRLEPALLSLFCRELNAKRLERGLDRITDDLLRGSQTGILSEFYSRSLNDLGRPVRRFVEDQLVTESGYRDTVALERAIATPGVSPAAVDRLIERRLLRSQELDGVRRIELTHDVLVDVIRRSRDERRARERAIRRGAIGFAAAALVLAVSVVWAVLDHRRHTEDVQVAEAAVKAALGETSNLSAQAVLSSARRSWDSAAAQGLDRTSREEAAARSVEAVRDDMTRDKIRQLTRQLYDADSQTRKAALADLYAYVANPLAVDEALALLESPPDNNNLIPGRINVLTFLRNTQPAAWTRDQITRARSVVGTIEGGPQTLDLRSRVIEEFDSIELALITLYIQFAPERDRPTVEKLRGQLLDAGMNVPAIDFQTGNYPNEIRYFFRTDSAISVAAANRIERSLADDGRRVDLRVVRPRSPNAREGRIELWIRLPGPGKD
jgi:Novel STAND NTPase 1